MKKKRLVFAITAVFMLISIMSMLSYTSKAAPSYVHVELYTCHETNGENEELNTFDCEPCEFTHTYPKGDATTCIK